jgi:hypothetical protein
LKRVNSVGSFVGKEVREFWISTINRTKALGVLCNRLFSTPPNSVPSECAFSAQNYIHTKTRNSLKPDRVDKLTYIYMNSCVFDGRTQILTADEEEQLEEEIVEMDDEDIEFEE